MAPGPKPDQGENGDGFGTVAQSLSSAEIGAASGVRRAFHISPAPTTIYYWS